MLLSQPMKSHTAAVLVALAMNAATQNREGGRSNWRSTTFSWVQLNLNGLFLVQNKDHPSQSPAQLPPPATPQYRSAKYGHKAHVPRHVVCTIITHTQSDKGHSCLGRLHEDMYTVISW